MEPSRFADAASRLDHLIAEVKARQFDVTGTLPPPPEPVRAPPGRHPDESWQRAYASRSIRPQRRGEPAVPMPDYALPPPAERPPLPPDIAGQQRPANINGGHIGAGLGKPAKKRGVLARLFRGRDR